MNDECERLQKQIDYQRAEEKRNVEKMQRWIKVHEEASRGLFNKLFNREEIRRAGERMNHFANVANHHRIRANKLRSELQDLEYSLR